MSQTTAAAEAPVTFQTSPDRYRHWKLEIDGDLARLTLDIQENMPLRVSHTKMSRGISDAPWN